MVGQISAEERKSEAWAPTTLMKSTMPEVA